MNMLNNKNIMINFDETFNIQKHKRTTPMSMNKYHYHNSFEIYYLCSGERSYFIKDKTYHIKKGTLVLINEYDIHCTRNIGELGHERIVLNFNKKFIEDFAEKIDTNLYECFEKNIHVIDLDFQEQIYIESLLNTMYNEYIEKKQNFISYLKTAVIQLLLFSGRHTNSATSNDDNVTIHKTISKVIGYINTNYNEDITLQSISEMFFISTYYFSGKFKEITGLSFIDYLNNVRIKEAQVLLKKSNFNITQISEMVGYKNTTYFGRIFKKLTGMSPINYKKIQRYTK